MILSVLSTFLGGKWQTIIAGVLVLAVVTLGATTYCMIKKNGAQKQIIKTLEGDIRSMKAVNAVDRAVKEKSDQDLKRFQVDQVALVKVQSAETRRIQNIVFGLKQRPTVGVQDLELLHSKSPIDEEVATDEEKKQIDCLDRLVPDVVLDELFGVRNNNPDQN